MFTRKVKWKEKNNSDVAVLPTGAPTHMVKLETKALAGMRKRKRPSAVAMCLLTMTQDTAVKA